MGTAATSLRDRARPARYPFSVLREAIREHTGKVLEFAIGAHGPVAPAALLELVRRDADAMLQRSRAGDVAAFAEGAVAMLAREYGATVDPACVLPVPGGRPALGAVVATLLEPNDPVLVTEPGYPALAQLASRRRARVVTAWLDPEREFAPALNAVAEDVGALRAVALNYPNNPTGAALCPRTVGTLAAGMSPDAILFNDAAYAPLTYDRRPSSLLGAEFVGAIEQPVIELHSLGKVLGVNALPVSFLVGTESVVRELRDYGDHAWSPASALVMRTATHCMADAAHLASVRETFAERIARLRAVITDLGFEPYPTPAGLYVLCRVPRLVGGHPVDDAWSAAESLLGRHDLAVMPWDAPSGGYLRFSALCAPDDLDALARLASDGPIVSS
jgi:aspartate/methionine/tyrosine aminotransferase